MQASANPSPAGPTLPALWPNTKQQLQEVKDSAAHKVQLAFERFQAAHTLAQKMARDFKHEPRWPAQPALLHPDLQASNLRRVENDKQHIAHQQERAELLWRVYQNIQQRCATLTQTMEAQQPPPRLVHLVGGPEAFVALPDISPQRGRIDKPQSASQHPIVRGQTGDGRLFVVIRFTIADPVAIHAKSTLGEVRLERMGVAPDSAWGMLNPQRFCPQETSLRANLTPHFANMAGRRGLIGAPDAEAMFTALTTLVQMGSVGPYRLLPRPGPDGFEGV